ncbi:MAG: type II toxin-antitoxin system VapC family toxin [Rhizomicrobium sp.]
MILVDTSVLLDVLKDDPQWADWSQGALEAAASRDELVINDIVYAELSTRYTRIEALDAALVAMSLGHSDIPRAALFLAGKAFLRYRARGGTKTGVLSDFFIGAHAAVERAPLLTRDVERVRAYFPAVDMIAP